MDKMRKLITVLFILTFSSAIPLFAEEDTAREAQELQAMQQAEIAKAEKDVAPERWLKAVELLTGYGRASLKGNQPAYELYPINLAFDFDLKPLLHKANLNYAPLFEFQLEPFVSPVSSPNANVEAGMAFMLKAGILPETWQFQPYIKGGVGMLYMSQHTLEQGTQFNFLEQGCAGAHYYLDRHWAITGEFRFRHVSNSGIDEPNAGINTMFYLLGATYQF